MTAKEAKEKTLYFWRYIAAHPFTVRSEYHLPKKMFLEISKYINRCPLCDYIGAGACGNCPLGKDGNGCIIYHKWYGAKNNKERKYFANELIATVEAWEAEE
jgi:hypothetical protein